MSKVNNNYNKSGIGFFGLLQLIFITLKILGYINWSWVLVLLPAIILAGVVLLILIVSLIALFIDMYFYYKY